MYIGIKSIILDTIKEYIDKITYTENEETKRIGSLDALNELLDRLNEKKEKI